MMKKSVLSMAVLLFVLFLAVPSMAWQGRVAGAGDAAGLIEDESDFLIHPAAIASGKGFNAYGYYRLTYEKAKSWDYSASAPSLGVTYPYAADGRSWKNEGQVGAAFNLGAGRMGVFFDYTGVRGKYSGDEIYAGFSGPGFHNFDLENQTDNFAIRAIYGLPLGPVKVGAELQVAYLNEQQEHVFNDELYKNYPWGAEDNPALNLLPYMIPFDSKYWEAQAKASVAGAAGPATYAFTLRGGLPFGGDNEYVSEYEEYSFTAEGKVKGFNVAGDLWVRVPVSERMALPFVVSAGYRKIERDGSGISFYPSSVDYEHEATDLFAKVGGGVDVRLACGAKVAAGLYYDYLKSEQNLYFFDNYPAGEFYVDDYTDMPKYTQHRLTLKALAEKELNPMVALRGGFGVFYGMVKSDYAYSAFDDEGPYSPLSVSTDGSIMGVNASLGATIKLAPVALEPFINAGYMKYKTDGDGSLSVTPVNVELSRTNWLVGGGLAVKF